MLKQSIPIKPTESYFDRLGHYGKLQAPVDEYGSLPETPATPRNIGWTLGNECPYRCNHCYSMNAREKGQDMSTEMVDRIVSQLQAVGVETVNLGGNEPLFTNGINPKNTLLPYIIRRLHEAGIIVGLTTSGITAIRLFKNHRAEWDLLNDCDISFDSPFKEEHNKNRGAPIFHQAIEALEICRATNKPHTCILAAMKWNFSPAHIDGLVDLATRYDANVRINPLKPVEPQHMDIALTPEMYFRGMAHLLRLCVPLDLGEPPIAAVTQFAGAKRCPCGRTSFRIHSITPTGEIYVSPCVYLHDYKSKFNILEYDLKDIVNSPEFRVFRQRNGNPDQINGCSGCELTGACGGGCAARSYLHHFHTSEGERTMLARDPYCPKEWTHLWEGEFPQNPTLDSRERLVHMDYLCTWIGRPNGRA